MESSWLSEKELVITGRLEVRPGVTVHTFVLALADRNSLFDPSGLAVRFVPHHFHLQRSQSITWFPLCSICSVMAKTSVLILKKV